MLKWFMQRLVERLVPLIATSFSSTVETLHALTQAEQQSELEEAARRYESERKPEIAELLRRRAAALTSTDPAAQALEIVGNVAGDEPPLLPTAKPSTDAKLAQLPDLEGPRRSGSKKKGKAKQSADGDPSASPPQRT